MDQEGVAIQEGELSGKRMKGKKYDMNSSPEPARQISMRGWLDRFRGDQASQFGAGGGKATAARREQVLPKQEHSQ